MNRAYGTPIINRIAVSFTRQEAYRWMFLALLLVVTGYNFHRYILQYGHAEFVQNIARDYQPTPFIWQVGKYIVVALFMAAIYSVSTFERYIKKDLAVLYGLIGAGIMINTTSSILYGTSIFDEYEYQLFALLLLPLALIRRDRLLFLRDAISGPWLNAIQYILLAANAYVILNYLITGRLPFHAYAGIIVRFGGLWDDPNALGIFSVFLFVYAFRRKQYVLASLHVLSILLTFSLTGILLLLMAGAYLSYRRVPIMYLLMIVAVLIGLAGVLAYIFQEPLLAFYAIKRESVELHTTFGGRFYPLPLLQPMFMHETWWFSMLYNYAPLSIGVVALGAFYTIKAFFVDPESLQRFYFILFAASSIFLPFLYIFPLNFFLFFWVILYIKDIRF